MEGSIAYDTSAGTPRFLSQTPLQTLAEDLLSQPVVVLHKHIHTKYSDNPRKSSLERVYKWFMTAGPLKVYTDFLSRGHENLKKWPKAYERSL